MDETKVPIQIVEFIESYLKIGNTDYQWNDNHRELIRCKDCKYHRDNNNGMYCGINYEYGWEDDDYCSRAERR